jgi:hypothetical protein
MTMVGKGGGNFYVVILAIASIPMHEAAATGQFVLLSASVAAMLIVQKNRSVLWPLAVFIGIFTALAALGGGKLSLKTKPKHLKKLFAFTNWLAAAFMFVNVLHAQQLRF